MHIHSDVVVGKSRLLIVETAGRGGGEWGRPGVLRLVEVPNELQYAHARQRGVKRIDGWRVDLRHQGPRSNFCRKLASLKKLQADIACKRLTETEAW